jgi:hypothetical protein
LNPKRLDATSLGREGKGGGREESEKEARRRRGSMWYGNGRKTMLGEISIDGRLKRGEVAV